MSEFATSEFVLFAIVLILSLVFTYTNGLQDGSSVTAGLIVCRVLTPAKAVILVACCELLGAAFGGSAVAQAVRACTRIEENPHLLPVLSAGLTAAILWNFLAKKLNLPSSSTHALFGGLLGAFLAAPGGSDNVVWGQVTLTHPTGFGRILVSLFTSPLLGFLVGYCMLNLVTILLLKATTEVNRYIKIGQIVTVSLLAFGHGANDPQKIMGIIMLALHSTGYSHSDEIPIWVRLATGLSISIGVLSLAPGIVKKVGNGIYKLRLLHGFVTEAASSFIIVVSSITGCPVSTSQVISSTVMGVGSGERFKDVRWLVARGILVSWFLTIPCAGLCAYVMYSFGFRWLDILIAK